MTRQSNDGMQLAILANEIAIGKKGMAHMSNKGIVKGTAKRIEMSNKNVQMAIVATECVHRLH